MGERFLDNQRIEGNIAEMLDGAIQFVNRNMRVKTIVDPETGKRKDRTDYPITAIREAVLNALVHRDYSIHTEGMPIQLIMFENRMEIRNLGGIYGRIRIDQLGKVQPDTRNVMKKYVMPLVERGILKMSIPDKTKSTKQLFYCEQDLLMIYVWICDGD